MRQKSLLLVVPAGLALMTLTSCSTTSVRLNAAATKQGTVHARVTLPAWPEDCRIMEQHASLAVGEEVRSVLKRERLATDRANSRVDRCAKHYDNLALIIK